MLGWFSLAAFTVVGVALSCSVQWWVWLVHSGGCGSLLQLEAISELNPIDLRKQLMVEFRGEEGIDEGGLQKELFQLLIEKLFDPMYGKKSVLVYARTTLIFCLFLVSLFPPPSTIIK